jgi:thiol:disulfide interchange protein DsbA
VPARTDADVAKLVAHLGIDTARYDAVARSFAVNNRVARVAGTVSAYRIDSVPTFVVDGRWVTSPSQLVESGRNIPDPQINSATMTVLDHLVEKVRQQKGLK